MKCIVVKVYEVDVPEDPKEQNELIAYMREYDPEAKGSVKAMAEFLADTGEFRDKCSLNDEGPECLRANPERMSLEAFLADGWRAIAIKGIVGS
jgi:hypothetical protein